MKKEFQAVVFATSGYHSLHPLTQTVHKSLLPVANKPLIHHTFLWLENHGILDIIVLVDTSRLKFGSIKNYEGKAKIEVICFDDFQGTATALRSVRDKIRTDFLVVSTDYYTDAPLHHLTDLHRVKDALVTTLLVQKPENEKLKPTEDEYDLIGINKQRILYYSPQADEGDDHSIRMSCFKKFQEMDLRQDLSDVHKEEFLPWLIKCQYRPKLLSSEIPNQFSFLLGQSRLPVPEESHVYCAAFIMIGGTSVFINSIASYKALNRIKSQTIKGAIGDVHSTSQVGNDSLLGEGTRIGEKTTIKRSIIGNNCNIGSNVKMTDCVLMDSVMVEENCKLEGCVITTKAVIKEKTILSNCEVGGYVVIDTRSAKNESFSANLQQDDD
ncbi:nucleotide-diphospho-sugar transferase [Rozella allomycis CSF55]|uniref:Translation initiation factor eIF2B subunit gamma n=1 Tax=Rozella allomycis (strain CSF55) TaxID=988480 RepID=A0A4P9YES9_ROZAC|nr:nucleotide-diphospho-sugar transferase [Rozella allomycis CSF55]